MRLRDLGFLLAFSTALLPWGAVALARHGVPLDLAAWYPLAFIFGLVPLIDAACAVSTSATGSTPRSGDSSRDAVISAC